MINPYYSKISQTETTQSSMSDFEILSELGYGSFGIVYKVRRKSDGIIYALKKVNLSQLKPKEKANSLNEIRILASINNKNIIQYKESFFDKITNSLCLVMEYAECGDLEKKISVRQKKNFYFNEYQILNIIIQIIKGLKCLHDYKIMHRDIKSANIFLFNDNIVKIGDLNVSKVLRNNLHNTQTGTPYYASPEVWDNKSYDFKSDIWSLGCLIYEICALKAPFRGNSMKIVYDKVIKGIYEPIPKMYSRALGGIVYICLQTNPINRPTCEQLLNIINNQYHLFNLLGKKIKVFSNDEEIENKKDFGNENNNDNCNLNNNNNDIDIGENEGKVINNDNNKNNENNNEKINDNNNENNNNSLLGTIKMPKRLNDINLILPKNRYISSISKRNIHSANYKFRNKLPKININKSNFLNERMNNINDINPIENYHYKNLSIIEKNKILNQNYSEGNIMINNPPIFKNNLDKYNNINFISENHNLNNNEEINDIINTTENTNINENKILNKINNNKINDTNEKAEKILQELEKQNKNIINYHFLHKNLEDSKSNQNIFNNNIISNKISPINKLFNEGNKLNNQNNQFKIPQRSQSHNRYNISYFNQLTENNKDISLININFNNLSYINNINNNNCPIKITGKNNNPINLKKKILNINTDIYNKDNYPIKDENKSVNLISEKNDLSDINIGNKNYNENCITEIRKISPIKRNYHNILYVKRNFKRNYIDFDKKRAISAFNQRKLFKDKLYNQDNKHNASFLFGNRKNLLNVDNNNNLNNYIYSNSNNDIININYSKKKERVKSNVNFNNFNRKLNSNLLKIKNNYNNLYNQNSQNTIDSIKLRTRKNNSNLLVPLPSIDIPKSSYI